jgi:hypothetical protein
MRGRREMNRHPNLFVCVPLSLSPPVSSPLLPSPPLSSPLLAPRPPPSLSLSPAQVRANWQQIWREAWDPALSNNRPTFLAKCACVCVWSARGCLAHGLFSHSVDVRAYATTMHAVMTRTPCVRARHVYACACVRVHLCWSFYTDACECLRVCHTRTGAHREALANTLSHTTFR